MISILKQENATPATYGYYLKTLRQYLPNGLFYINSSLNERQEGEIVCCLPMEPIDEEGQGGRFGVETPDALFQIAEVLKLDYYCSYPLTGIQNAAVQYAQASTCLARGKREYYECALEDLADLNGRPEHRCLALHPALHRILDYDRRKNTSLYHMLKTYLRCERNRVLTAQELFMHKNTLVYRIGKVSSLFSLDLDDAYEREYLLVSFRCLETMP